MAVGIGTGCQVSLVHEAASHTAGRLWATLIPHPLKEVLQECGLTSELLGSTGELLVIVSKVAEGSQGSLSADLVSGGWDLCLL